MVGLLGCSPSLAATRRCLDWAARTDAAGSIVVVPEVADFEVRRELIRLGASVKLARLDALLLTFGTARVTPEAWRKAAEFWAIVRKAGVPTADPHALDGEAIVATVAATIAGPDDRVGKRSRPEMDDISVQAGPARPLCYGVNVAHTERRIFTLMEPYCHSGCLSLPAVQYAGSPRPMKFLLSGHRHSTLFS